jgi:predicted neuraminidase
MRIWNWIVAAIASVSIMLPAVADHPAVLKSEFIYDRADFPSCHASTIAEVAPGRIVAAWFGGTAEKNPDVGIWVARNDGNQWTSPVEVANGIQFIKADGQAVRHPCWNPVLFQPKQGPLMLFYKVGPTPSTWWGMLTTSSDGGVSWSQPSRLPERIDGPVKNKPVQLPSGDILCGSSTEDDGWRVHFEVTSDLGKTWQRVGPVNDGKTFGAIQPSILTLGGENLLALGRTRQGKVFQIASNDLGKSWQSMEASSLPNPNSGTDAVTLQNGQHWIIYNHTPRGRSPLNIAVSSDGKIWKGALELENQPGEYSYPAIVQTRDGLVHVTYTWRREKIKHAVIDPKLIEPREIIDGKWPQ